MTYGKVHRFFLRTVASQGVLSITDAQAVLEKFNDEEQLSVTDLVKAINDEIRPYFQEIKITKDEVTNENVIVFLSLADDAATKAQNLFSATELEYFRVLIEHIMSTESRQITGINAMNLVSSMKSNFTKTDAQKVLNTWCRMHYFDKEQDNYVLGVRAIHEFEGYFRQNMQHAVEECFLCKHVVFRGYNCPGCAQAIHTKCLFLYLEKVQKWPCCKIDFEQEQLERLNNESSRLQQTQSSDTTRHSEENNTEVSVAEPTQAQESSEVMDVTQEIIPEISQRVTRKRKRQISPKTQVLTSRRSSSDDFVEEPTQLATAKEGNIAAGLTQIPATRRSTRGNTVSEPTQVSTTRRSKKDNIVEEPTQIPTTKWENIAAVTTQIPASRRSTRSNIVSESTPVSTTRRSKKDNIVTEPTQVPPTRRSTRSVPETVVEVQESFENMNVVDEAVPEVTQRVTRKRRQQM